jgi:hypothetical protein
MKKFIAVPIVAVVAAVGAASAAGFAGGVSANPVQSGQTGDLECAHSASVVTWGTDESKPVPTVDYAVVKLGDSECQGQGVYLIALNSNGSEMARFQSTRIPSTLASGDQYVKMDAPAGGVPVANLNAVRITVDQGFGGMPVSGSNTAY